MIEILGLNALSRESCVAWAMVAFFCLMGFVVLIYSSRIGWIEEDLLISLLIESIMPLVKISLLMSFGHHLTPDTLWICNQRRIDVILVLFNWGMGIGTAEIKRIA